MTTIPTLKMLWQRKRKKRKFGIGRKCQAIPTLDDDEAQEIEKRFRQKSVEDADSPSDWILIYDVIQETKERRGLDSTGEDTISEVSLKSDVGYEGTDAWEDVALNEDNMDEWVMVDQSDIPREEFELCHKSPIVEQRIILPIARMEHDMIEMETFHFRSLENSNSMKEKGKHLEPTSGVNVISNLRNTLHDTASPTEAMQQMSSNTRESTAVRKPLQGISYVGDDSSAHRQRAYIREDYMSQRQAHMSTNRDYPIDREAVRQKAFPNEDYMAGRQAHMSTNRDYLMERESVQQKAFPSEYYMTESQAQISTNGDYMVKRPAQTSTTAGYMADRQFQPVLELMPTGDDSMPDEDTFELAVAAEEEDTDSDHTLMETCSMATYAQPVANVVPHFITGLPAPQADLTIRRGHNRQEHLKSRDEPDEQTVSRYGLTLELTQQHQCISAPSERVEARAQTNLPPPQSWHAVDLSCRIQRRHIAVQVALPPYGQQPAGSDAQQKKLYSKLVTDVSSHTARIREDLQVLERSCECLQPLSRAVQVTDGRDHVMQSSEAVPSDEPRFGDQSSADANGGYISGRGPLGHSEETPVEALHTYPDQTFVKEVIANQDTTLVKQVSEDQDQDTTLVKQVSEDQDATLVKHVSENQATTLVKHVSENQATTLVTHVSEDQDATFVKQISEDQDMTLVKQVSEDQDATLVKQGYEDPDTTLVKQGYEDQDTTLVKQVSEDPDATLVKHVFEDQDVTLPTEIPEDPDETLLEQVSEDQDTTLVTQVYEDQDATLVKQVSEDQDTTFVAEIPEDQNSSLVNQHSEGQATTLVKQVSEDQDSTLVKEIPEDPDATLVKQLSEDQDATLVKEVSEDKDAILVKAVSEERNETLVTEIPGERDTTLVQQVSEDQDTTLATEIPGEQDAILVKATHEDQDQVTALATSMNDDTRASGQLATEETSETVVTITHEETHETLVKRSVAPLVQSKPEDITRPTIKALTLPFTKHQKDLYNSSIQTEMRSRLLQDVEGSGNEAATRSLSETEWLLGSDRREWASLHSRDATSSMMSLIEPQEFDSQPRAIEYMTD